MASDLVSRLRAGRVLLKSGDYDGADLMRAWCDMAVAADTIERQTAALQAVFDNSTDPVAVEAARAVLRSQDKGEG